MYFYGNSILKHIFTHLLSIAREEHDHEPHNNFHDILHHLHHHHGWHRHHHWTLTNHTSSGGGGGGGRGGSDRDRRRRSLAEGNFIVNFQSNSFKDLCLYELGIKTMYSLY